MSIRIPFTAANGRWRIGTPPEPEVYQLDDNAHKLSVVGDLPDGYAWTMYVSVYGKFKNSILLTRDAEGASVTLTADQLAYGDTKYFMQLVGVNGSITRKTNEISVYIPRSLIDGDADWPETPDVFEQAQEVVLGAVTEVKETGDAIVRNAAAGSSTVYNIADAISEIGYVKYEDGVGVSTTEYAQDYRRSPFLFFPEGTRLHLSGFQNAERVATVAVYDTEKAYIQSASIAGNTTANTQFATFVMPVDGYVRFSCRNADLSNVVIRNVPREKELNILVLGNSFSQDAFAYLPPVLNELLPDYAITYGVAYEAGCGAIKHMEMYNNDQNYDKFWLWRSGADHWSRYTGSAGYSLSRIMPLREWDIVYMQSRGSIAADRMEQDMTTENITPGRELLRVLQDGISHNFTFLTGQWLSFIEQSTGDTLASYFRMRKAIKYVADRLGVDGVIPIAAGIAFARMDATLDALGEAGHMLYDSHQQAGLPALISTYVIAQYILEMLGREDVSVYGSTFVPNLENATAINATNVDEPTKSMTHGSPVGVTAANILKAQEIAVAAAAHPDSVYGETDPSEGSGSGAVDSVNGKTGAVVLDAEDVGALSSLAYLPAHAEAFRSSSQSYSEIISAWDSLASDFPNHIEKASIGQDSGGNTIYAYTIKSGTDGALDWVKPMPENRKVIWLSGIHGHEITVPYDDFVFFDDLVRCHGENPTLQWLWDHITFVVVPAICPWGLDHGVRVNANGVNLNRNFPASSWELSGEGTNDYSGASAGSEAETQAIMSLVNANKDALFALNRHTMNAFTPTSRYAYISSLLDDDHEAAFGVFKSLDGICKSKFDVFADMKLSRNLFAVCDSTATGTLDQWFNEVGVRGFLLEMSPYFTAEYFPDATAVLAQNINATVMGNLAAGFAKAVENTDEKGEDALPQLEWEAGVVSNSGGDLSNAYRIRTTEAVQLPVGATVTVDDGYEFKVNTYSAWSSATNYTMLENGAFGTSFQVKDGGLFYRFSMRAANGTDRVSDDIPGTAANFHMAEPKYATEQWVQQQGYLTQHQDISGKADKIPRIAKASTDTTAEIEPNKLYVFPEMASLTITLAAITDNTIVNEYHFIFESGATATTTTFPAIPGLDDFAAETNTAYEVSILEGRALVTSWEVSA